jgi:hypothetical protein
MRDQQQAAEIQIQHDVAALSPISQDPSISPNGQSNLMHYDSNYLPYNYEPKKNKLQFKKLRGSSRDLPSRNSSQHGRTSILSKDQNKSKAEPASLSFENLSKAQV